MTEDRTHPVDRHVGGLVRLRRKALKMSQGQLAQAVGLTFQQVQKYERGANRISASMLWEISKTLQVPVGYFFTDAGDPFHQEEPGLAEVAASTFVLSSEGMELASHFPRIKNLKARRRVTELVRLLAENDTQDAS